MIRLCLEEVDLDTRDTKSFVRDSMFCQYRFVSRNLESSGLGCGLSLSSFINFLSSEDNVDGKTSSSCDEERSCSRVISGSILESMTRLFSEFISITFLNTEEGG